MKSDFNQKESEVEAKERSLPKCLNLCPDHKVQQLTHISLEDCESGLVFKCNKCKKSIQNVEIKQIAFSDDHYIFENYPKLHENVRQNIKVLFEQNESKENMVDYIRYYFQNLQIKILQQISDMEKEMTIKAKEIDSFKEKLKYEYNKLCKKNEFRQILFDDSNINHKSDSVKIFVKKVMKDSNEIEQKLMGMINSFNQSNENIKSQNLNKIISQKINNIFNSKEEEQKQVISKIIYY